MSVVVDVFSEKVVGLFVAREGMHCHHIASGDTVSEELECSRSAWLESFSGVCDLRDAEDAVLCSFEGTSVVMVSFADEFEIGYSSSWMNDLESIRGHRVSLEIEREVHVFQEKRECVDVIEELADFFVLDNLKPVLLLFAIGGLGLVFGTVETEILRVGASIGQSGATRVIRLNRRSNNLIFKKSLT